MIHTNKLVLSHLFAISDSRLNFSDMIGMCFALKKLIDVTQIRVTTDRAPVTVMVDLSASVKTVTQENCATKVWKQKKSFLTKNTILPIGFSSYTPNRMLILVGTTR